MEPVKSKKTRAVMIFVLVFVIAIGFGIYKFVALSKEYEATKAELSTKVAGLETKLSQSELEKTSLNDALYAEQTKNDDFEEQIEDLTGAVGKLTKLSKTDPELLKKYSRVYFLNENYEPPKITNISTNYLFNKNDDQFFLTQAQSFLKKLLDAADDDGLNLKILSGYRSFGTQAALKSNYTVIYGAGTANQFSADQGYSEHQLGTAVDFTNPVVGASLNNFETTDEYTWLVANAHKYGFILSYPKGNTYYQYEPWHWRFVGVKLAKKLRADNVNFYDMDQRQIDTYLISLFD